MARSWYEIQPEDTGYQNKFMFLDVPASVRGNTGEVLHTIYTRLCQLRSATCPLIKASDYNGSKDTNIRWQGNVNGSDIGMGRVGPYPLGTL